MASGAFISPLKNPRPCGFSSPESDELGGFLTLRSEGTAIGTYTPASLCLLGYILISLSHRRFLFPLHHFTSAHLFLPRTHLPALLPSPQHLPSSFRHCHHQIVLDGAASPPTDRVNPVQRWCPRRRRGSRRYQMEARWTGVG